MIGLCDDTHHDITATLGQNTFKRQRAKTDIHTKGLHPTYRTMNGHPGVNDIAACLTSFLGHNVEPLMG